MKPEFIQQITILLEMYLKNNQWEAADRWTDYLVNQIDLKTIDELWTKYSDGHFGLTIQSKIWQKVGGREYPSAKDFGYQGWMESGDENDPHGDIERAFGRFICCVGWNNYFPEIPILPGFYPRGYVRRSPLKMCDYITQINEIHREEKRRSLLADPHGVEKYGKSKYSAGQKVRFLMKCSEYDGYIATVKRAVNSAFVQVEFDDGYLIIQDDKKFELQES